MKGAVNCQHCRIDTFCALVATVVMFIGWGGVAVAAVLAVGRRKRRLKRSMMEARGIVRGTTIDIGAMFLIVLLYPVAQSDWMLGRTQRNI